MDDAEHRKKQPWDGWYIGLPGLPHTLTVAFLAGKLQGRFAGYPIAILTPFTISFTSYTKESLAWKRLKHPKILLLFLLVRSYS